jgi:hypothetical protein
LDWLPCEGIPLVAFGERLCGGYGSLSWLLDSRSHGLFVATRTLENKDEEEGVVNWKLLPTGDGKVSDWDWLRGGWARPS